MKLPIPALAALFLLSACATPADPAPAPDGPQPQQELPALVSTMTVAGTFAYGIEAESFSPCGVANSYWVVGTPDVLQQLHDAHDKLATAPYEGVFVRVRAAEGPRATDGFAEDYDATVRLTEVLEVRARRPEDCLSGTIVSGSEPEPAGTVTEERHPIDQQFEKCGEAEGWSTMGVQICLGQASDAWDKELNRTYGELMALLDEEQKVIVREAQRDWVAFRDAESASVYLTYQFEMGSGWGVELAEYNVAIIRKRVEQLDWLRQAFDLLAAVQ
jgi:uncharacterized protein YecT (DUF1311 family)